MRALLLFMGLIGLSATPCLAQDKPNYLALAISDGPTPHQRIVLVARGTSPADVVKAAYAGCYQRASTGFAHTCQVGYGSGWVVGTLCVDALDPKPKAIIDIEADDHSPEDAKAKAARWLTEDAHAAAGSCVEVGEYNANEVETARSVAKDPVAKDPVAKDKP